MLIENPIVKEL